MSTLNEWQKQYLVIMIPLTNHCTMGNDWLWDHDGGKIQAF